MRRSLPVLIGAALLVAALAAPSGASMGQHHHHRHVSKSGSCTDGSRWRLELGDMMMMDDIGVWFEVDTDKAGQDWTVKLTDDGNRFWSGTRTTRSGGDFVVHTYTDDRSGSDTIVGRAVDRQTGEVCRGSATI